MNPDSAPSQPQPSLVPGEDALKGLIALINDVLELSSLKPNSALRSVTQAAFNGALGDIHKALLAGYERSKPAPENALPLPTPE